MADRQERYVREVFDGNTALLPEVPACGWSDQRAARAALRLALVMLIREGGTARAQEVSEPTRQALAWMAARVEQHFGVPDVAAAVGLSTVRLQARFKRELNCSIGEHPKPAAPASRQAEVARHRRRHHHHRPPARFRQQPIPRHVLPPTRRHTTNDLP